MRPDLHSCLCLGLLCHLGRAASSPEAQSEHHKLGRVQEDERIEPRHPRRPAHAHYLRRHYSCAHTRVHHEGVYMEPCGLPGCGVSGVGVGEHGCVCRCCSHCGCVPRLQGTQSWKCVRALLHSACVGLEG